MCIFDGDRSPSSSALNALSSFRRPSGEISAMLRTATNSSQCRVPAARVASMRRAAVLERLGAEQAVDALPRAETAERARLRLRLVELSSAVDCGDLSARSATDEFHDIQQRAAGRVAETEAAWHRR